MFFDCKSQNGSKFNKLYLQLSKALFQSLKTIVGFQFLIFNFKFAQKKIVNTKVFDSKSHNLFKI